MGGEGHIPNKMEDLRARWTHLYKEYLPSLAKARDPVQDKWPVYLDHCFARIILDNAVGVDKQWTERVKQPAVKNMSEAQMSAAINLAERLATGEADLNTLNDRSLQFRSRKKRKMADGESSPAKRKKNDSPTISSYFLPSPPSPANVSPTAGSECAVVARNTAHDAPKSDRSDEDMLDQLCKIADSNLTPFRKEMLTLLCQIPPGHYSTYQAMSDYITRTSHKTCARAVGNAMRNNPFAPQVPCHRVLAADGSLGGFGGHWGENGKFANKKHSLLHEEGVRFDSKGKVKGPPFRDFHG